MVMGVVAGNSVGMRDFYDVNGHVFDGAHGLVL